MLKKHEDAKLAANLQRRQVGEQFTILDAASLPERPFNRQQRLTFTFAGAVAGLMLGFGLVAFLEVRDSSLKSEEDVARLLSLPVLALVPLMTSSRRQGAAPAASMLVNVAGTRRVD